LDAYHCEGDEQVIPHKVWCRLRSRVYSQAIEQQGKSQENRLATENKRNAGFGKKLRRRRRAGEAWRSGHIRTEERVDLVKQRALSWRWRREREERRASGCQEHMVCF
jgi:hypothetical protein